MKEWLEFARDHIYMQTPEVNDDGTIAQPIDAQEYEEFWKSLPKEYFPPKDGYPREERV